MLRAEHITKQYSLPDSGHTVFDAVSDVSLELKDGCVSSLVGESGSGKSVSSLAMMQLIPNPPGKVTGGQILYNGKDLVKLSEREIVLH